jgi:hypothetical protein
MRNFCQVNNRDLGLCASQSKIRDTASQALQVFVRIDEQFLRAIPDGNVANAPWIRVSQKQGTLLIHDRSIGFR